ncbi:uncharacterized protein LOC125942092 [Dermacentor silvarum]|uniref:uncharacterized protein LOC125942092 n=1 Tax=Dermacentor silvarum TaxID=543639 RepID=UPI0021013D45|nr:uncharacterized protein LOC125942092 [Dermacentor silvarum]
MHNRSVPNSRRGAARAGSVLQSGFSVDNVVGVHCAPRRQPWNAVAAMRSLSLSSDFADSPLDISGIDGDAQSSVRNLSLSSNSPDSPLEISGIGLATPPPLLYSLRKPQPAAAAAAFIEKSLRTLDQLMCEPEESFTQSEKWEVSTPRRGLVLAPPSSKKKVPNTPTRAPFRSRLGSDLVGTHYKSHAEASPSPLMRSEKKRPTGFPRWSLRRVAMANCKPDPCGDVKNDV